ncbi:hypothetical protein ABMC88_14090 [Sulfitobacter sp. HNIBRBA2951]|uniref:hypothetical protein n=1 Tax=Sulfitobacter aquimarinus TaxID=3158557 RepID=UPI0032DF64E9
MTPRFGSDDHDDLAEETPFSLKPEETPLVLETDAAPDSHEIDLVTEGTEESDFFNLEDVPRDGRGDLTAPQTQMEGTTFLRSRRKLALNHRDFKKTPWLS